MKRNLKILSFVLIFTMLFAMGNVKAEGSSTAKGKKQLNKEKYYNNQKESIDVYNKILNSFSENINTFEVGKQKNYPDYYGGSYIDEETGGLVILENNISLAEKEKLSTFAKNSIPIKYQKCDISFNEILQAINTLTTKINFYKENGIQIDSIADDIINGKVIIGIQQLTKEKEEIIRNSVNFDFLEFFNSDGIKSEASFGGGYPIVSTNNSGTSTIGFAATRSGVKGFVIAGHAGDFTGETFKSGTTTLGSVTKTAFYNNTTADAAFVKANTGVTPSYILKNGGSIWGVSTTNMPVNTTVHKYGKSTLLTSGKILSTNVTIVAGGKTIKNCCSANYSSASGDSGCPVMFFDGNYGGSKYRLLGIHSSASNTGNTRYFSPYSNIVKELGVTCIEE